MSNKKDSESEENKQIIATEDVVKKDDPVIQQTAEATSQKPSKKTSQKNSDGAPAEKPAGSKKSKSQSAGKGLIYLLLIIIIAAVVLVSYYFWDLQQKQQNNIKRQQQSVTGLSQQLESMQDSVSGNQKTATAQALQLQQLAEQIEQTNVISQQAIEVVNRSQRDWALAEVDYLLRIAHQRIEVARDIRGAIAALKGADARIEQLADLKLFNIRKQLAQDIAYLNSIHQADVSGVSMALDQYIAYLHELPFKSVKDELKLQLPESDPSTVITEQSETITEPTFVDSVIDTVKKIGDIKVHSRSVKATGGATQQLQTEQLLRTYLLSARLAALRFDQKQFVYEIKQASEILNLYYDAEDNRVKQLLETLDDYSALKLQPDLPELTKAWVLLQEEINASENGEIPVNKNNQEVKE